MGDEIELERLNDELENLLRRLRDEFENLRRRLHRHDPSLTEIGPLVGFSDTMAVELGDALAVSRCPIRRFPLLLLGNLTPTGPYQSLCDYIATSPNLADVTLEGDGVTSELVTARFLRACAENPACTFVHVRNSTLSALSLGPLLRESRPLTYFGISSCRIESSEELEVALAEKASIQRVSISSGDVEKEVTLCSVLRALGHNRTLQMLTLFKEPPNPTFSVDYSKAIRGLLETSETLRGVNFKDVHFKSNSNFREIAEGLRNSPTPKVVAISSCHFDKESTEIFEDLFKTTITCRLWLSRDENYFTESTGSILSRIVTGRSSSAPILLQIFLDSSALQTSDIDLFLQALKQASTMVSLILIMELREADAVSKLSLVIAALPQLRIRRLTLHLGPSAAARKHELLDAFAHNGRLEVADVQAPFFDGDDQLLLNTYCERNRTNRLWTSNPTLQPVAVWSRVFSRTQELGHGTELVYRSLLALEDKVGGKHRAGKDAESDP
jgi:hypothetical protein